MRQLAAIALQVLFYIAFMAGVGYFSTRPAYTHQDPALALVKLSFSHAGERKEDCRRLSPEEIADLPPNMRRPTKCSRERVPLYVELLLDDRMLYRAELPPSGLSGDGASSVYRRFPVPPGTHRLTAKLRDTRREQGFDHERSETVTLSARQNFVIDFKADIGGFLFL
ncbi:MAG: hypothetical protein HYY48_03245 [Gammaproteobacteria bacterium]|nr:hypothetical protein [Gammaproteobacteria bacterium]